MGDVRVSEDVVTQVVQTAVVRPGDTLVVRLAGDATDEAFMRAGDAFRDRLPGVKILLVRAEELAVYRPEPLASVELAPPSVDDLSKAVAENLQRRVGRQSRRTG